MLLKPDSKEDQSALPDWGRHVWSAEYQDKYKAVKSDVMKEQDRRWDHRDANGGWNKSAYKKGKNPGFEDTVGSRCANLAKESVDGGPTQG